MGKESRFIGPIEGKMKLISKALLAAVGLAAVALSPANAYESGYPAAALKAGSFIGSSAGVPPPGIYMFNQVFTFQGNVAGPGVNSALGGNTKVGYQSAYDAQGFLFVPGWTFLGATYDAVLVQPFGMNSIGSPENLQYSGVHNTYIVPVELSWKLGTSGFVVKSGLGIWAPTGTIQGPAGLGNQGNPWWTFSPELVISYLGGGWNLSVALSEEINTENSISHYTTGNIFHADFTATRTFGKWTLGPVAYFYGQVSDDSCSATCLPFTAHGLGTLTNAQRFSVWAVGGLIEYNFGPASLSVWATQEVSAKASNAAALASHFTGGQDFSVIAQGSTVFATLSYRLWAPEGPAKPAMFRK
jgi:hypothetical protein